jgi:uncharacterized LabA/DUF88 family protein/cold shock CspA family protein
MTERAPNLRVGVYVDVENVSRTGGRGLRFDTLREYACREGGEAIRLNAYLAFDETRAEHDADYRGRTTRYHFALRDVGFKVIEKPVQWFVNEDGVRVSKANSDLDLAVDMLLQSARLDRVLLVSGDGDFVQVVRALQNNGCRVELVGFQSVSYNLRCEADLFVSGFLIPGLLPQGPDRRRWGELGSRVRGTCRHYNAERGFGFLRYMVDFENLTAGDPSAPDSPYRDAFFHFSAMPAGLDRSTLPNRDMIFEFTLVPSQQDPQKMAANEIALVFDYAGRQPPVAADREPRPYPAERESRPTSVEGFGPGQRIPDVEDEMGEEDE